MEESWLSWRNVIDPATWAGALALAVFTFLLAWLVSYLLGRILRRTSWVVGKLGRKVDQTVVRYVLRVKSVLVFLVAGFIYASLIPSLRGLMGAVAASAGITALVVGLAAKSTLGNLVAGLGLAVYRPIRIGDTVSIEDEYGKVEDITLRHTIVRTWQHRRMIIPNEKLDQMTLINYSIVDPRILCTVDLGVSYDTDIDLARRLSLEEAQRCPHRLAEAEEPWLRVTSHGDFSIGLRLYLWASDMDSAWLARFWLLENIKKRFDREGVEIPFPYRTLVYKKDLPPAPREQTSQPPEES